ncbi:helix-turn-helix domain-containing protein [Arenibacter sp. F26102]|uniref:helix-turn-helix domain-containing protein n=1 Tax=Arenibacter sp. F26102 TaxID=2926416 RepID=UPI001FF19A10|nr:helix-turn-helix domain-containing protein [Arenibacter sp. F26102]MCK0146844.1 helix-turn-helix domain-containing protein [Arenibacter sp. F26102]
MNNPFDVLLQEIRDTRAEISEIKKIFPKRESIKRYSPQEVADATGVSVQTIWNALKDGRIHAKKFGKRYLISVDEFDRACSEIKTIKYKRS